MEEEPDDRDPAGRPSPEPAASEPALTESLTAVQQALETAEAAAVAQRARNTALVGDRTAYDQRNQEAMFAGLAADRAVSAVSPADTTAASDDADVPQATVETLEHVRQGKRIAWDRLAATVAATQRVSVERGVGPADPELGRVLGGKRQGAAQRKAGGRAFRLSRSSARAFDSNDQARGHALGVKAAHAAFRALSHTVTVLPPARPEAGNRRSQPTTVLAVDLPHGAPAPKLRTLLADAAERREALGGIPQGKPPTPEVLARQLRRLAEERRPTGAGAATKPSHGTFRDASTGAARPKPRRRA